jgi:hypothetical protein
MTIPRLTLPGRPLESFEVLIVLPRHLLRVLLLCIGILLGVVSETLCIP